MNVQTQVDGKTAGPILLKADPTTPALTIADDGAGIIIKAGTTFHGRTFDGREVIPFPESSRVAGGDYVVTSLDDGSAEIVRSTGGEIAEPVIGGFHYAPGGNAKARAGGDHVPAINIYSLWDRNFRPACPNPRGMFLETKLRKPVWIDIYKLGRDHHLDGTSKFGVIIADGRNTPMNPATMKYFKKLDYETAVAVMAHHGKQLLSFEEFQAGAFGVTEKTAASERYELTGLDAPRTSQSGMMQAAGTRWDWGHDGDPDEPRASLFGGSWLDDGNAGSRFADVAYSWPDFSAGLLCARGRSDHLQLG